MDTTETYIKMSDCEEIQSIRGAVWITFGEGILYSYDDVYYKCLTDNGTRWHLIWLPRQDQLQEMLDNRFSNRYSVVLADKFGRYCNKLTEDSVRYKLSMEQLWLAFVMKEKYNKTWDGEGWVIPEEE